MAPTTRYVGLLRFSLGRSGKTRCVCVNALACARCKRYVYTLHCTQQLLYCCRLATKNERASETSESTFPRHASQTLFYSSLILLFPRYRARLARVRGLVDSVRSSGCMAVILHKPARSSGCMAVIAHLTRDPTHTHTTTLVLQSAFDEE